MLFYSYYIYDDCGYKKSFLSVERVNKIEMLIFKYIHPIPNYI